MSDSVNTSGSHVPVWQERDNLTADSVNAAYPPLNQNIRTDVLVVGGGIAGLHIAYELLTTKMFKVVIVEDGKIGSGETGRTTGHLSVDNEYNDFLDMHGAANTAVVAESQQAAISRIEDIARIHNINCDFVRVPGFMFCGPPVGAKEFEERQPILRAIYEAAKGTNKLDDVTIVDDANIHGFQSGPAIRFGNQATFHPTKYLKGLASVITSQLGGTIYENTHFNEYEDNGKSKGGITAIMADGSIVTADSLVMATNVPLQKLEIIDRCEPHRTYAVALKILNSSLPTPVGALWWDISDPYYYVRTTPHRTSQEHSLLIVGGEDAKVGQHSDAEARYERILKWTRERWIDAGPEEYRWSGQVIDTADGLALIGRNPGTKNTFIHTGDNGDGLTYSSIGAIIIKDLLLGRANPWAATYEPGRQFSASNLKRALKALPDYVMGNLQDQLHYAKWLTHATTTLDDVKDTLPPGDGAVVRDGVKPTAIYKDEQGKLHKMTAVCPHLKGIVVWNSDEKTFDCPIHGSRFTCKGMVVNGPAKGDLTDMEDLVKA